MLCQVGKIKNMKHKAILNKKQILDSLMTDEEYSEYSILEILYDMRKLKGLVKSSEEGYIEVGESKENGQRFSEEFDIWFNENELTIIK